MISIVILTHNRLNSLKRCIESIRQNTIEDYEIIVVDNASKDGTKEYLQSEMSDSFRVVFNEVNEGVCARNKGFEIARGEYIAQIDSDVQMLPYWDIISLKYFKDEKVGGVGQQGGLVNGWLNLEVFKHNDSYVDFLTGFYMMLRKDDIYYSEKFNPFWHEELHLSFQYKEKGWKLRMLKEQVCVHVSERRENINWEIHDRNLKYVYDGWKDNQDILRLGGN